MKLRHENYSGDLGYKGTIRTEPEGYYACSIKEDGELDFRGLEVITRHWDKKEIKEWWGMETKSNVIDVEG